MKKFVYALFPLLFSFLFVSAQSYKIAALSIKSHLSHSNNQIYYFQPGNQLLTELYSYEVMDASRCFYNNAFGPAKEPPVAYMVGKLNTGEKINLRNLLHTRNTNAINLESDKTYQITFSGNLRFQAVEFRGGLDGLDLGYPINIDIEFYGTDTFTLRPNETNIIQVDMVRPPKIILQKSHLTKMRWQLQVTNK